MPQHDGVRGGKGFGVCLGIVSKRVWGSLTFPLPPILTNLRRKEYLPRRSNFYLPRRRAASLNGLSDKPRFGSAEFWLFAGICIFLVCSAGLMSGLTIGLMSLDVEDLKMIERSARGPRRLSLFKLCDQITSTALCCTGHRGCPDPQRC